MVRRFDYEIHINIRSVTCTHVLPRRVARTALIASFFDGFDPEGVTAAHFERWKGDPASAYALGYQGIQITQNRRDFIETFVVVY